VAKFLKHLNLQVCKYWYILCCVDQTETCESANRKTSEIGVLVIFFVIFGRRRVNCDEMDGDRPVLLVGKSLKCFGDFWPQKSELQ